MSFPYCCFLDNHSKLPLAHISCDFSPKCTFHTNMFQEKCFKILAKRPPGIANGRTSEHQYTAGQQEKPAVTRKRQAKTSNFSSMRKASLFSFYMYFSAWKISCVDKRERDVKCFHPHAEKNADFKHPAPYIPEQRWNATWPMLIRPAEAPETAPPV